MYHQRAPRPRKFRLDRIRHFARSDDLGGAGDEVALARAARSLHLPRTDQQRLGQILIAAGAILLLWIAWKLLWGRFDLTRYAGDWTTEAYRRGPPSPILRGDPE